MQNIAQIISVKNICGDIVYMFSLFIDCLYNCCFGIKKKKYNKIHECVEKLEDLTLEEYIKVMKLYNNKCC